MAPKRWIVVFVLALAAIAVGVSPLAAQDTEVIECTPPPGTLDAESYYLGAGSVHAANSQHAQALIDYTCALRTASDFAPAYARRALSEVALGNDDAALADFDQAIALDETLVEAYINRGSFYVQAGNFGLAIADYSLALALDPNNVTALNNRAVVHAIEGDFDLALADLEQALTIAPDEPGLYATQGGLYSALAAQSYQHFLETSRSDQARLPAGTPGQVLAAVDDALRTGNYGIWLALLRHEN